MGADIYGWVEVRQRRTPYWYGIIQISPLLVGSGYETYDMLGCLFGVLNYAHFKPIAEKRGLPTDAAAIIQQEAQKWEKTARDHTWITWSEIEAIDWEEEGEQEDSREHRYIQDKHGQLVYDSKAIFHGRSITDTKGTVYKFEKIRRKEALTPPWQLLFNLMKLLAQQFGGDNVRMVVWFHG